MKSIRPPQLEDRRAAEFAAQLRARAHVWMPGWGLTDGDNDFGSALLEISALFNSEVAERLNEVGDKMRRGLLDWLGVRGKAALPARLPVVLKLADTAREAVLARAPVQMQADAGGQSVVFETETDVNIVPCRLAVVIGADPSQDALYLPPPGLDDLQPLEALPRQWQLKSFASAGTTVLQLDPELGLKPEMVLGIDGQQYTVVKAENGIVTIEPPAENDLPGSTRVTRITAFAPFDGATRNSQKHALYLGDPDLLNIEAEAKIIVAGARTLENGYDWAYYGKAGGSTEPDWHALVVDKDHAIPDALILNKKASGLIELFEIEKLNARWIRATKQTLNGAAQPVITDNFSIRIGAPNCEDAPCPPTGDPASLPAEGLANTTPLVLNNIFYPLGKEPKQFDAFYLGCQEAFSKKDANVQLCFEMADQTFSALAALREGSPVNPVLAGIGIDRALHVLAFDPTTGEASRFQQRGPQQPPMPQFQSALNAGEASLLDKQSNWRLPLWAEPGGGFSVGVPAANRVWVWREHALQPQLSGWVAIEQPLDDTPDAANSAIDGLIYLAGAQARLIALRDNTLFVHEWKGDGKGGWEKVALQNLGKQTLVRLIPVQIASSGGLVTSGDKGMLGLDSAGQLYKVSASGKCEPIGQMKDLDVTVCPVAMSVGNDLLVAAVQKDSRALVAIYESVEGDPAIQELHGEAITTALDAAIVNDTFQVIALTRTVDRTNLVSWAPFSTASKTKLDGIASHPFRSSLGAVVANGAPTLIAGHVIVPGANSVINSNTFEPARRVLFRSKILPGITIAKTSPALKKNDLVVRRESDGAHDVVKVVKDAQDAVAFADRVLYELDAAISPDTTGKLLIYPSAAGAFQGSFAAPNRLTLDANDNKTKKGAWVRIGNRLFEINDIDRNVAPPTTTLTPLDAAAMPAAGDVTYILPVTREAHPASFLRLRATSNGNWDADLLNRLPFIVDVPGKPPRPLPATVIRAKQNKPEVVLLGEAIPASPAASVVFAIDNAFGRWRQFADDTSTNPELSWEYWNGKGWWKLVPIKDSTRNLKASGAFCFKVPADIALSDWAGKSNYWIRARLVGGDYGREKVTIKVSAPDKTDGTTTQTQTIERSSEGIRAPLVVTLTISYYVCDAVPPRYVLTLDSGSYRNQSDANRKAGAIVETFVPLAVTLDRYANMPATTLDDCPAEGDDQPVQLDHIADPCELAKASETAKASAPATAAARNRGLYIGLDGAIALHGSNVNVLLLLDERDFAAFAPLTVEALVADRFVPIVAKDATRALSESGLLTLSFEQPATSGELFGRTMMWIRLLPEAGADAAHWSPSLRGAYLNGVWAGATETLTYELLGSSVGAPEMTVQLARPPVLDHSVELRVREALGEEERKALLEEDEASVLNHVERMPGDWVLWKQVIDPGDEPADARVYAIDEAAGEIRFGDGLHGRIPPIGRDCIVAFRYQRTEPGRPGSDTVPGNNFVARTPLNLVSPIESVESVIAADRAAGGAPSEPDERVLRFGYSRLRHRDRGITLNDIEDLVLESSIDVAQARVLAQPGRVQVVVVNRGRQPIPNAAQMRALRRYLLGRTPASLGIPGVLQLAGPGVRRLRIDLVLQVASLDHAAGLAEDVKDKLQAFFDSSTGGIDQEGWALGANPRDDDVAFALMDAPHLDSISSITLHEVTRDGREVGWPAALQPSELVVLDEDPIRIKFKSAEVTS